MYKRHRFPPEIIQYAIWVYFRFNLSIRDVEGLSALCGVIVRYEAIRLWVNEFGPKYAKRLKKSHHGDVVDVLLQAKRNGKAAERFFKSILKNHHNEIRVLTTDR